MSPDHPAGVAGPTTGEGALQRVEALLATENPVVVGVDLWCALLEGFPMRSVSLAGYVIVADGRLLRLTLEDRGQRCVVEAPLRTRRSGRQLSTGTQ